VSHVIVRWLGPLLRLLSVVLGVNRVAIGLQLMIAGLSEVIAQSAFSAPLTQPKRTLEHELIGS